MKLTRKGLVSAAIGFIIVSSVFLNFIGVFMGGNEEMSSQPEIVVLETSMGVIEIDLNWERAPITAANYLRYVEEGFYDGTIFHRVILGFMIQGGSFTPDGSQKQTHDPIKLESRSSLKNERGTIAMARTSVPDSATSQFFINLMDNDFLDYGPGNDGFAVFGEVVSGMDVVDAIAGVQTESRGLYLDWPVEDVVIEKAYSKEQ